MSDKWPETSEEVPVLKFDDREAHLYQAAFPTFGGSMGVRPLRSGEPYWYKQIKGNFLYPPAGVFANPPFVTEGALLPRPRPLRCVTSAGKEILYLSSEESVGSSQEELSSWSNIFAGVLRDLGIDPEERAKKAPTKKKAKKVTVDTGATCKKGGSSRAAATTQDKGEKKKSSTAASKSSGSAGSRIPEAGATPSSIALDEEEEEDHEEAVAKLVSRKRTRAEAAAGAKPAQKVVGPVIGKHSSMRSLYKFSPEALKKTPKKVKGIELEKPKESTAKKTKFIIKPPKTTEREVEKVVEEPAGSVILEKEKQKETETAAATEHDTTQGPEVTRITGLDQPPKEKEKEVAQPKEPEVVKPTEPAQHDAPTQTVQVTSVAGGSTATMPEQAVHKDVFAAAGGTSAGSSGAGAGGSGAGGQTVEGRSFPLGEVNRQRARNHESLYRTYIIGEGNARSANHQIVRKWRNMYRERADWEKYRERLVKEVQEFEQLRSKFAEEKAAFDVEKKAEEWGREGLKNKLQAAVELLSKEHAEWKKVCEKDNRRIYVARSKITDLEAEIATLKGNVE
ncbi:hypothetical protein HanPI659440_Chr15g0607791 [Helianthus annuus]|nr:hypothetical protein HanPI659440_Chr15g0607791 [Helianthus annuus]